MTETDVQAVVNELFQLYANKRYDEAIALGVDALERIGEQPDVLLVLGLISVERQDLPNAQVLLEAAHGLAPKNPDISYNLGVVYQQTGDLKRANRLWEDVVKSHPHHVAALKNLAVSRLGEERYAKVRGLCDAILKHAPNDRDALNWKAFSYFSEDAFDQADALYRKIIELYPNHAEAHYRHGLLARDMVEVDEAVESLRTAVALNPDHANAHFELAHALLMRGDYREGFEQYEWRRKRDAWPADTVDAPYWSGETAKDKSVLVKAEQGHGDAIQFLRYLPHVAERVGRVCVSVHPALMSLVDRLDCVDGVEPVHREQHAYDFQVPIMSLAHIFATTVETVPPPIFPEIAATPALESLGPSHPKARIGVVWAGSDAHDNDKRRSCPPGAMARLFQALPDVAFYSFQLGRAGELPRLDNVVDLSAHIDSYEDTAALVKGMDLIVSVDTSLLHLAGSMNVPAWGLLAFGPDWRWMLDRADTPWYPSVRLYRQERPGAWDALIESVAGDLKARFG